MKKREEPVNPEELQAAEPTPAQRIRADWRALVAKLSYRGIVNNIPFFAFVALLGVVYISSNGSAIDTLRTIEKRQQELKELRWRYMDAKTRLMATGVEADVIRRASAIGLKPLMLPAYKVPTGGQQPQTPQPE